MSDTEWFGYRKKEFEFAGRNALIVFPSDSVATPKWLLKTEYFGAFPELETALIERGYHLAYLENLNRWGVDADQDAKRDFADYLAREYGLEKRCVCIGMSCGGFHAVNFASRYPSYVSLLYLDAPLLSFRGWSKEFENQACWISEQKEAYGFTTEKEIEEYTDLPINRLSVLTDNKIPVALVYGGADTIVSPELNAEKLLEYYEAHDAPIKAWCKPNCDHHPHGPNDISEVVDYIEKTRLSDEEEIKTGRYRHFKGNEYEVLGVAKNSETLEKMVIYKALYGEKETWVRPASMWNEIVVSDGKRVRRFTYIEN